MHRMRMTKWATIALGLILGLAACGGSGTVEPSALVATDTPDTTAAPGATAAPDTSAPPAATPAENPDVGPLNTAVVTIGSERYEFSEVSCSIFAPRYIQAGNFGGDPEVSIVLPPEGSETDDAFDPPSVRVRIGDDVTGELWVAGDDGSPALRPIPDGSSQIDSYTVPDGRPVKATGTATFIELNAHNNGQPAAGVSGSFEVSCP